MLRFLEEPTTGLRFSLEHTPSLDALCDTITTLYPILQPRDWTPIYHTNPISDGDPIIGVANRRTAPAAGLILSLPRPKHHHLLHGGGGQGGQYRLGIHDYGCWAQGFLTESGIYLTRAAAWIHATRTHQVAFPEHGPAHTLYSEHLW